MSGTDPETEQPVVGCMRCVDGPPAIADSDRGTCTECGEAVWFDPKLVDNLTKRFRQPPTLRCLDCSPSDEQLMMTPEQLSDLLSRGLTPRDIAFTIAVTELRIRHASDNAVEILLETFQENPDQPLAQEFRDAFERATVAVNEAVQLYRHRN